MRTFNQITIHSCYKILKKALNNERVDIEVFNTECGEKKNLINYMFKNMYSHLNICMHACIHIQ